MMSDFCVRSHVAGICMALMMSSGCSWLEDPEREEEQRVHALAEQRHWPAGVTAMACDPARVDLFDCGRPEDGDAVTCLTFHCGDVVDVNRLIWQFSEIKSDRLVLSMTHGLGLTGHTAETKSPVAMRISRFPNPAPPTLHLCLEELPCRIDELDVPLNIELEPLVVTDQAQQDVAITTALWTEHERQRSVTQDPKPWESVPCPSWAKVDWPRPLRHYVSRFGLPEPVCYQRGPIAPNVAGIDFWHANHFLVYRPETRDYLYGDIKPFRVDYIEGTLPAYERVVARYTANMVRDRDRALVLLKRAMPDLVAHPHMPPLGPDCPDNRGADDESLLASGKGWCNEQARVFVRLCHVAGIPARLIFLTYTPPRGGHVVAEFHADGRWCMADASWFCVFPGQGGRLMSAEQCHLDREHRLMAARAYQKRFRALHDLSDERLVGKKYAHLDDPAEREATVREVAAEMRRKFFQRTLEDIADELWCFGVMPYPLPDRLPPES